ncbi:hypothetical protein ACFXNW_10990 [Nocardia sp. NPDC059180]|uniref:hypothetical protein n=1 Tax=Nocardia sp. NPDC059180 TaxID=3346761 RepID=UPI0036960AB4
MVIDPHDVHSREDLQAALRGFFTAAGLSYQQTAEAAGVAAPNTIHDWVHGKAFPHWKNLAPVLGVWGITEAGRVRSWKDAHERARTDSRNRPGVPLQEVIDPFSLEVHELITVGPDTGLPALPAYVPRAHDERLAAVVDRALSGRSGLAVLLGESSSGKTRALWEALAPLRARGGWRLWHPPRARHNELADGLSRIGPGTVVWLNETQRYFLAEAPEGRDGLAGELGAVLNDARRAPVLILGSLWSEHYRALCADPSSATRRLFQATVIEVPGRFAGADLAAMRGAAEQDPRLAVAYERAEDGEITQYLAGGPELVDRYEHQAGVTARAVIEAAMDALRMGHPNVLPFTLLRDAASAYLSDTVWDCLDENWFETALAETGHPCKGARGPITPIRERPVPTRAGRMPGRRTGSPSGEPVYQLADYLDQHGRRRRAAVIPPIGFWEAAAAHADPEAQHVLGGAAQSRGLYRDAAQLWKNAAGQGHRGALQELLTMLDYLFLDDPHPAARAWAWAATHLAVDDPDGVVWLLDEMREAGAHEQVRTLLERDPATHVALDVPDKVVLLLHGLRRAGAHEQVTVLLERCPAAHVALDDPRGVVCLLRGLQEAGAHDQVQGLLERDPAAHVALDDMVGVVWLLDWLRETEAHEQVRVLLGRNPAAHGAFDYPDGVDLLLRVLRRAGAQEQVEVLLERAAAHVALDSPGEVGRVLEWLAEAGAHEKVRILLERDPATHVALDDSSGVARLLEGLRQAGAHDQVRTLLERDPAGQVAVDEPHSMTQLLDGLRQAGAHDQVRTLLGRNPATRVALDYRAGVARMLDGLRRAGAYEQVQVLAERAAAHVALDNPRWVRRLRKELRQVRSHEQRQELLGRAAAHVTLDSPDEVNWLLDGLRRAGAQKHVQVLAKRAAAHISLDNPAGLARLLDGLAQAGAHEQMQELLERAAAHIGLDNPAGLARPLDGPAQAGAHEQMQELLERAAAHIGLDNPAGVAWVLDWMREVGAHDHMRVLLERAPAAHAAFDNPFRLAPLQNALRKAGAHEQEETLFQRASAAGLLRYLTHTQSTQRKGIGFGQEPDHSPAAPWSWHDLE